MSDLKSAAKLARQIIWRYRHETPLGNQPYMIAHEADEAIERIDQALAKQEQSVNVGEPVAKNYIGEPWDYKPEANKKTKQRPFTKQQRDLICIIYDIATGSTTINSLPHIAKIANQLLTEDVYTQPKQEQSATRGGEPVGVFHEDDDIGHVDLIPNQGLLLKDGDKLYTTPQFKQEQSEPVAWMFEYTDKRVKPKFDSAPHGGNWQPLYTNLPTTSLQQPDAYGYARRLADAIWKKHYKSTAPQWEPFDNLIGVLTQIDNMTSGLTARQEKQE
jgi:hypothetical protein